MTPNSDPHMVQDDPDSNEDAEFEKVKLAIDAIDE
jgi:hypothetical protein